MISSRHILRVLTLSALVLFPFAFASAIAGATALSATYTGETLHVADGGVDRGTAYLGNLDVDMELTFGEGDALRAYIYLLGNHGEDPGLLTGDTQGVSNIAAPPAARMYEAWVEGESLGLNLRAGLYDLNSEFDSIETAALFAHSSFGIGPDFSQAGETDLPGFFRPLPR